MITTWPIWSVHAKGIIHFCDISCANTTYLWTSSNLFNFISIALKMIQIAPENACTVNSQKPLQGSPGFQDTNRASYNFDVTLTMTQLSTQQRSFGRSSISFSLPKAAFPFCLSIRSGFCIRKQKWKWKGGKSRTRSSRCCGLAFTQVKNIWLGCFARPFAATRGAFTCILPIPLSCTGPEKPRGEWSCICVCVCMYVCVWKKERGLRRGVSDKLWCFKKKSPIHHE